MKCVPKVKTLGQVEISHFKSVLERSATKLWEQDRWRSDAFAQHRQTEAIVFRFSSTIDPADYRTAPQWRIWSSTVNPLLTKAASFYPYKKTGFCRILLAKLDPGAKIEPHVDCHPVHKVSHRIHIPIITNPQVVFVVDGMEHNLQEGLCYEISNLDTHSVCNNGCTTRIHLIADMAALPG